MPTSPTTTYLTQLRAALRTGDATERTHYSTLKVLLESLTPGLTALVEPKRIACGAPDFHVRKGQLLIGYVEAKDVGLDLDEVETSEQLKDRYLPALPNLILTNYLEFRWYVDGKEREDARASLGRLSKGRITVSKDGPQEVAALLTDFLSQSPQGAASAKDLALRLARLTHQIRDIIVAAFSHDSASADLRDLLEVMRASLLPDLTPEQFADMFSQTLTYGFFAARCHHPVNRRFLRLGAAAEIPKTNPLLRRLFESITGEGLEDEPFAGYVDDVIQLLDRTDLPGILEDFGRRDGRTDPIIHFYQTFLVAYDPKLRELRGVYYTPDEVVSYMVRSVDHLLRTRFACADGLASVTRTAGSQTRAAGFQPADQTGEKEPRAAGFQPADRTVLLLDPACGTGTFLYAIISHIREQFMRQRNAGAWSSYVRDHLLPRLFGFELLMAPYAVAHLKLGMQLAGLDLDAPQRSTWAYDFSGDERLGIYLTNTLDEAAEHAAGLFGPMRVITEEANAAARVKRFQPIMVVIGNPPYSGHSANRSWEIKDGKRVPTFIGTLLQDYYQVDGHSLGEKNPKWLQNDYVKFLRFGQWRIEETKEGVLAFITDNSYLDNPTFRGMRQHLLNAFTDIYLLDLHGNSKKKERTPDGGKDENVFDIQQGVCIALFVKERDPSGPARLWHADLWGTREGKYAALVSNDVNSTEWQQLHPTSPAYLFVPQDTGLAEEYAAGTPVNSVFPVNSVGFVSARDALTIHFSPEEAWNTVTDFASLPTEEAREKYHLGDDVRDWRVAWAQQDLNDSGPARQRIAPTLYRPFDTRFTYYTGKSRGFICMPRREVMRHMRAGANLGLITTFQTRDLFDALVTRHIIGHKSLAAYDINSLFPLYLYPSEGGLFEHRAAGSQTRAAGFQPADPGSNPPRPTAQSKPLFVPVTADLRITRRNLPHWEAGGSSYSIRFSLPPSTDGLKTCRTVPDLSAPERAVVKQSILFWHSKKWIVHILTVMPDHVHLIATPLQKGPDVWYPLSEILHSVKRRSSLEINRLRRTRGSLWLGESYDRLIRNQHEFDEWFSYILGNAANKGLTMDPMEWDGLWLEGGELVSNPRAAGFPNRAAGFQPAGEKNPAAPVAGFQPVALHLAEQELDRAAGFQPAVLSGSAVGGLETRRTEITRVPNLHPDFLKECERRLSLRFLPDARATGFQPVVAEHDTFGPEDVFNYIYAILHCPTYRTRYAEFLKRDFPRIPLTSDRALFASLFSKGRDLVALHLLESPAFAGLTPAFPTRGSNVVERVQYNADEQSVYINKERQHFTDVPTEVWSFHVGGYQVCDKWLKDRKGRALSFDDLLHYRKIVVALGETIRLMAEIDALIPAWPLT